MHTMDLVMQDGRTALHFAAKSGRTKVISLLLAAGAGASIKDSVGAKYRILAAYSCMPVVLAWWIVYSKWCIVACVWPLRSCAWPSYMYHGPACRLASLPCTLQWTMSTCWQFIGFWMLVQTPMPLMR